VSTELVARLAALGQTVACAESLTGGLVTARLIDTPGASTVVRGGVVAYASDLKVSLLGVDQSVLERHGAVDADVAGQMATGVCRVLGSHWGLATTGVAGPDPADGVPVGTVFVAVAGLRGLSVRRLSLGGDRGAIRRHAADAVIALLAGLVGE